MTQAIEYYFNFVRDAYTGKDKSSGPVLQNLRNICESPPSLHISVGSEILGAVSVHSKENKINHARSSTEAAATDIDWDISVESSQIDWDIGTVDETDDGLGPYEIINAGDIMQSSSSTEAVGSDLATTKKEHGLHSEISWDVGVETPQDDVIDDVSAPDVMLESEETSVPDALNQFIEDKEERSQFLDTDYRNKILDDLYEIKAFLNQRLAELKNEETLSLQHQVQAVAPFVLQQYAPDGIEAMQSGVSLAISLLTNRKTRDLIMIPNSKRFLDRLVNSLEEKKNHEVERGVEGPCY